MLNTYCPVCHKEVEFNTYDKKVQYNDNGVSFYYYELVPVCPICKSELFVDEIEIENQKRIKFEYERINDIISNEDIKMILEKYNISKRVLPIVLELGELTITRYLDGYIPSKKISSLLKDILNNPLLYKEYLEKNKDKISKNAYVKSNNKVNNLLGISEYDDKLEKYSLYIISHNEETTNLVLNKLLYFCEIFYRLFYDKKLFKSRIGAWKHGPVYGQIYYENKCFGNEPIIKEEVFDILSSDEILLVDKIIECFGIYSGRVLSYFTHEDGPWKEANDTFNKFIDNDKIDKFVRYLKKKFEIKDITDIHKYSDYMFEKYKNTYTKKEA